MSAQANGWPTPVGGIKPCHGVKELEIEAGSGYFWDTPIYNQSKTVCFIMKNQGISSTGWSPHSIIKVTSQRIETILVNSDLNENWTISKIFNVSEDGKRLLVDIHYISKQEFSRTHFKTRPVILEVQTKKLIEIKL